MSPGVGVGVAHGKLVLLPVLVEGEGEGEDVVVVVLRRLVVVNIRAGYPLPEGMKKNKEKYYFNLKIFVTISAWRWI